MLDEPDQLATIRGLREGNREAWIALYDGYCNDVWRYACRLLGPDTAAVADVVQETFLAAAQTARQFDPNRGPLWGWLAGIAHHRVAWHWRQAARDARVRQLAETGADDIRQWLDRTESPDELCERSDLADLVRRVLAELPAEYATLLTAKYLDDRSLAELAQQCGSSVDAIKSKLARARRQFRAAFEELTEVRRRPGAAENVRP